MLDTNYKYVISFPHIGNYYVIVYNLLKNIIDNKTTKILVPKHITKHTLEVGSDSSPDFVCVPFKYNMGNYIESLEAGANVLIQAGGGCRYGYYSEVQEQILKDMGYDFLYISLMDAKGVNASKIYNKFKKLNPKLKFSKFLYHLVIAIKCMELMDGHETYIRENVLYEKKQGEFKKFHVSLLEELKNVNSMFDYKNLKKKYWRWINSIELSNKKEQIKVGIVGELYTSMEPFSTFFLENELAKFGIKTKRYTTVTYLLFKKKHAEKKLLKTASKYIEYPFGADGTESIAHTLELCDMGYDGIIHIKPFGCTPEINAMPILNKISEDKNIPIMYMTFDSQTSETGIKTRLEAFYDMLVMKKNNSVNNNRKLNDNNKVISYEASKTYFKLREQKNYN